LRATFERHNDAVAVISKYNFLVTEKKKSKKQPLNWQKLSDPFIRLSNMAGRMLQLRK
jgi:hypothetical protein